MDSIDEKILEILKKNSKRSYTNISEELDVSEATVRNRVNNLVEENVIKNFTINLGRSYNHSAYILVKVSTTIDFEKLIDQLPENLEVNEVTGKYDLFVKAERNTKDSLNEIIDDIRKLKGVENTVTHSILDSQQT